MDDQIEEENGSSKKKKKNMKNTKKVINFIPKYIKEKNIKKDFIDSLEINYNKFTTNINEKINPNELCKNKEIDINQEINKIEKYIGDKNYYFIINTEL